MSRQGGRGACVWFKQPVRHQPAQCSVALHLHLHLPLVPTTPARTRCREKAGDAKGEALLAVQQMRNMIVASTMLVMGLSQIMGRCVRPMGRGQGPHVGAWRPGLPAHPRAHMCACLHAGRITPVSWNSCWASRPARMPCTG